MESNLYFNSNFDASLLRDIETNDDFGYRSQLKSIGPRHSKPFTVGALVFTILLGPSIQKVDATNIEFSKIGNQALASLVNHSPAFETSDADNLRMYWQSQLKALALLPDNWDGEGAKRISTTAIQNAQNIINQDLARLDIIEDIYGNENGSVTIEWNNNCGEYVGIQIGRRQMSYYVTKKEGSSYFNNKTINEEGLKELFSNLFIL